MVDVVVRLHDPTDPSTERTAPPSSAHVQLDDVPRTPIQQSFTREFRQHDGVLTVMMLLPMQGFNDQLVSLEAPPAPVYKGARGEAGRPSMAH